MELGIVYYLSEVEERGIIICKDDTLKLFDVNECEGIKAYDYVTFEIDSENKDFAHILKPLRDYHVIYGYFHGYQLVEKKGIHYEDYINIDSPCGTTIRDTKSSEMLHKHEKELSIEEKYLVDDFINGQKQKKEILNKNILEEKGEEIRNYIDKLDINEIVKSFKIEIKEYFLHKPGGDDRYIVDKEYSVASKDDYITSFLPNKIEELYSDSGYCTAESMRTFSDNETGRQTGEEEQYKNDFIHHYKKERHYYHLLNNFIQTCLSIYEKQANKNKLFAEFYPIDKVGHYFRKHDCGLSTCCAKTLEEFVELYNHNRN